MPVTKPLGDLARGSCEIPQPPEAPKKAKKAKKHKKGFEAEAEELDERQKHDIGLLFKDPVEPRARPRPKRGAKRRDEPMPLDPVVMEVLESLRSDPAWSNVNGAESLVEFANSLEQMHQLQEVIKFLAPQARQLDAAHQRAQELDAALKEAQVQMERDAAAKIESDKQKAEAVRRLEELELKQIETNGQLLQKDQQLRSKGSVAGSVAGPAKGENDVKPIRDMEKLEKLLKDAILHGAKLGKAKKELEDQVAEQHAEQQRLQRRLTQLNQEAGDQQQLRARYRQRMERMESKLLRQRDRIEDLEADLEDAESREERVEERLAEYMRQCHVSLPA